MSSLGRKFKRKHGSSVTRSASHEAGFNAIQSRLDGNGANVKLIRAGAGQEKMSEALTAVIEPYTSPDETLDMRRNLLMAAVVAWNMTVAPNNEGLELARTFIQGMPEDIQADTAAILAALVLRKEDLFPDNKRMIIDFELKEIGDEWSLVVAATLPEQSGVSSSSAQD